MYACLAFLLAVGVGQTTQAQDRPTFTQYEAYSALMAGRSQYEQGEYLVALRNFDKVVQLDKDYPEVNSPEVYLDRGNTLFALGRYEDAITDFSTGIAQSTRRVLSNQLNDVAVEDDGEGYQSVRIVDLDRNPNLEREYALLYHNRGVAQYYLGRYSDAVEDFELALSVSPDLHQAQDNLENARLATGRNLYYEPEARRGTANTNTENVREKEKEGLLSFLKRNKNASEKEPTISADRGGGSTRNNARDSRNARKYYPAPKVTGQSYDYITIESIEVTDRSTLINVRVSNYTKEAFPVRLHNPGHQSAFFITDRTRSRTYRLKSILGLPPYPQSKQLRAGSEISFTLEFERLLDGVDYIHLIEGNTQTGKEWNFYDVRLN